VAVFRGHHSIYGHILWPSLYIWTCMLAITPYMGICLGHHSIYGHMSWPSLHIWACTLAIIWRIWASELGDVKTPSPSRRRRLLAIFLFFSSRLRLPSATRDWFLFILSGVRASLWARRCIIQPCCSSWPTSEERVSWYILTWSPSQIREFYISSHPTWSRDVEVLNT